MSIISDDLREEADRLDGASRFYYQRVEALEAAMHAALKEARRLQRLSERTYAAAEVIDLLEEEE